MLRATGWALASPELEWVLTSKAGVFSLGCVDRQPRRKYHSLLSVAEGVLPEGGKNLILDLTEEFQVDRHPITLEPLAHRFVPAPWPTWSWTVEAAHLGPVHIERQIQPSSETALNLKYMFSPVEPRHTQENLSLLLRPQLLSRPLHTLLMANARINGKAQQVDERTWEFQLYPHDPHIVISFLGSTGVVDFVENERWGSVEHTWEAQRGYGSQESYFDPGAFRFTWNGWHAQEIVVALGYRSSATDFISVPASVRSNASFSAERPHLYDALRASTLSFTSYAHGNGGLRPALLAGLPWFGPWARDTFVCMPGFARAVGGKSNTPYVIMATTAHQLLHSLTKPSHLSAITMHGADTPWLYLWALEHLMQQKTLSRTEERVLLELGAEIADAIVSGRQQHVHAEPEGGIRIDEGPWASSWMDAMFDSEPVTPRHGYPVDINALFVSGLGFLIEHLPRHRALGRIKEVYEISRDRFIRLFSQQGVGHLGDVYLNSLNILDTSIRPNCLWALALPRVDIPKATALQTLQVVRSLLLTPVGLRTLAQDEPGYRGECAGNQRSRDLAYHQGTVWPWLLGIYADAVLRWEGRPTLEHDLGPVWVRLEHHLFEEGCIGHCSEIFDGDAPHKPRGAPAQAWSSSELFRILDGAAR